VEQTAGTVASTDTDTDTVEAAPAAQWVTLSRPQPVHRDAEPVRPRRVVAQLAAGLLAVLVAVGLLGSLAAQRLAEREAVSDAANTADVLANAVVTPSLTNALVAGDAGAVRAFDAVVRERVLGDGVVRVKLWAPDGRVVYADEPQLIGRVFPLTDDQRSALAEPRTKAEVSDLRASENEFETAGRLLEVYRPVWTPDGTELLFEVYSAYEPVQQRAGQLWRGFAGVTVSSLLLVVALMTPIVWRLLRRLVEAQRQREKWLERAVDASDAERRRVAASLHDGPVQELVATSFAAAGAAGQADALGQPALGAVLRDLAAALRGNVKALRSLLVDIYPPSLADAGLASALGDLADSVRGRGVTVHLDLPGLGGRAADELDLTSPEERLVFRVAQECLRNTATHAAPCTATVSLAREEGRVVLDVVEDGQGFDPAVLTRPQAGHLGVRVLGDVVTEAGATLQVASAPGRGTHWRLVLATTTRPESGGAS
jgi:signal transduction histidine kinase